MNLYFSLNMYEDIPCYSQIWIPDSHSEDKDVLFLCSLYCNTSILSLPWSKLCWSIRVNPNSCTRACTWSRASWYLGGAVTVWYCIRSLVKGCKECIWKLVEGSLVRWRWWDKWLVGLCHGSCILEDNSLSWITYNLATVLIWILFPSFE